MSERCLLFFRFGPGKIRFMRSSLCLLWIFLVLASRGTAWGQVPRNQDHEKRAEARGGESVFLDTDSTAIKKLEAARDFLNAEQWADGIDLLRQISEQHADKLVSISRGRYVNVQTYCGMLQAQLPAEGLKLYRSRVDPQARQWFEAAARENSEEPLLRIVQQAFASSYGDRALLQLGDRAWERGDLAAARAYWQKILPSVIAQKEGPRIDPERVTGLAYPDTRFEKSQIRARLVLASLLQGNLPRARQELREFKTDFPKVAGKLAGKNGNLTEILQGVLKEAETGDPRRDSGEVTTFAGNPQRNKVLAQAVDVGAVQWSVSLKDTRFPVIAARRPEAGGDFFSLLGRQSVKVDPRPGYFPVIYNNVVLACDDVSVFAWNLQTGKPAWPGVDANSAAIYTLPLERRRQSAITRPIAGLPWYTLTVDGGRAYARLGSVAIGQVNGARPQSLGSFLVCLDVEGGEGKLVWLADASQIEEGVVAGGEDAPRGVNKEEGGNWSFDGSPVAAGERIYVGLRRSQPRPQVNVACLDAASGRLLWNRKVCSGLEILGGEVHEAGHQVLTLADGRLYYATNLGAIAAIDARDGRLRWVATYPHIDVDKIEQFTTRQKDGPNPCLYHDGIVVAAPTDADSLLAYEAETGRLLWERRLPNLPRGLLGVARGKLIVSGNRPFALAIETGEIVWRHEAGDPEQAGFGRGVLAGDLVYWPTSEEIQLLDQDTGLVRRRVNLTEPIQYGSGNLLVTEGYLLIAEQSRLVCRCEYGRLIKQYQDEIVRRPRAALPYYLLATAEQATSKPELALLHFRQARDLAAPEEQWESQPLRQLTTARLHRLLDSEGGRLRDAGKYASAAQLFSEAATLPVDVTLSLQSHLDWADALERDKKYAESASALQRVLDSQVLSDQRFSRPEGNLVRQWKAARWATREIGRLIASHGRTVYQNQEQSARELFQEAVRRDDLTALRRALERYSPAAAAPLFWLRLARQSGDQGSFATASIAFRSVLESSAPADQRREALLGLARQSEARRFYRSATSWWRRLEREFPEVRVVLAVGDTPVTARQLVAERLRRAEYQTVATNRAGDIELSHEWELPLVENARCLFPEGDPPGADWSSLLVVDAGVTCLDARTGKIRWELTSDDRPVWAGFVDDLLLLGSPNGLLAVEPDSGRVAWRHPWQAPASLRTAAQQSRDSWKTGAGRRERVALRNLEDTASLRSAPGQIRHRESFPLSHRSSRRLTVTNRRRGASVRTVSYHRSEGSAVVAATCEYRWDGTRILCLVNNRFVEAVHPLNGETEWSFQPNAGTLQSDWCANAGRVSLQTLLPNRTLVLDAMTGSVTSDATGLDMSWQSSPVPLSDGRLACVTSPLRLQVFDPAKGRVSWSYEGPLSQAHAIPAWLAREDMLLLVKDGAMLARVDPATGNDLWSVRFASIPSKDARQHLLSDKRRIWYAGNGALRCFDLKTGAMQWEQYLGFSNEQWQLLDLGTALAIVPRRGTVGAGLLLCDKETGEFRQRAFFSRMGSHVSGTVCGETTLLLGEGKVAGWKNSR